MSRIPWSDIEKTARGLGLEPCALAAVCEVESAGDGFLPDGRPKILFEGQVFWRELKKAGLDPARYAGSQPDIIYPQWTKEHYQGGGREYDRLKRAQKIHEDAALKSASWGAFQIMGFNHALCGFDRVHDFAQAMGGGYPAQLKALGGFLAARGLVRPLKVHDWSAFARGYNGPGYAANRYDEKLRRAYEKCRGKK